MSNNYWGEITWIFLHTIAEKIKDKDYQHEKLVLLNLVKRICSNLPCPDCKQHAVHFMKRVNITHIATKIDFKILLFNFHNEVNGRLKKEIPDQTILERYKQIDMVETCKKFIRIFSRPVHNNRLMMDSLNRNLFMKDLLKYLENNMDKFDC